MCWYKIKPLHFTYSRITWHLVKYFTFRLIISNLGGWFQFVSKHFALNWKVPLGPAEFFRIYLNEFEKQIELDQCRINYVYLDGSLFNLSSHMTKLRCFIFKLNHFCSWWTVRVYVHIFHMCHIFCGDGRLYITSETSHYPWISSCTPCIYCR